MPIEYRIIENDRVEVITRSEAISLLSEHYEGRFSRKKRGSPVANATHKINEMVESAKKGYDLNLTRGHENYRWVESKYVDNQKLEIEWFD